MKFCIYRQKKTWRYTRPEVYLQDVAKLACGDARVLNRNKVRQDIYHSQMKKPGRYVVSAADLIHAVAKEEPNVDVTHVGRSRLYCDL